MQQNTALPELSSSHLCSVGLHVDPLIQVHNAELYKQTSEGVSSGWLIVYIDYTSQALPTPPSFIDIGIIYAYPFSSDLPCNPLISLILSSTTPILTPYLRVCSRPNSANIHLTFSFCITHITSFNCQTHLTLRGVVVAFPYFTRLAFYFASRGNTSEQLLSLHVMVQLTSRFSSWIPTHSRTRWRHINIPHDTLHIIQHTYILPLYMATRILQAHRNAARQQLP